MLSSFFSYTLIGDSMDKEIKQLKEEMKRKRKLEIEKTGVKKNNDKYLKENDFHIKQYLLNYSLKILLTVVITLVVLITLKSNMKLKTEFYRYVFDTNFDFATVNQVYKKYIGSDIPFQNLFVKQTKEVFQEKLKYKDAHVYKDGVKLLVDDSYLVPVQQSGIVVFVGEKEGYGNTVIIQQVDGIDLWYGNVDHLNIKLYDYVEKGTLLGETKNKTLYLVYKKEGKVLDYKSYLS